jgi:hypothetical protein
MMTADPAVRFDGSSGFVSGLLGVTNLGPSSEEVWFNTTTTSGGELIGLCTDILDNNCFFNNDRHLYMTNGGKIVFMTFDTSSHTVQSANSYNDGQWHQAVGTWVNNTLTLYIDGAVVDTATGGATTGGLSYYWHVGGNSINGAPSPPSSIYFGGTIDEPAIYDYALTASQVANHYTASGR